jgi:hypothetical protein
VKSEFCLYGSRKRADAPLEFSVDTGVGCYLFGAEHYFCRYLDAVFFEKGFNLRNLLKKWIKQVIGDAIEGNIETAKFCQTPPVTFFSEINYIDVFQCFYYGDCDILQRKIAELYQYKKFFEYCECIPRPPIAEPKPEDDDFPEIPGYPPGSCGKCFSYWIRDQQAKDAFNARALNYNKAVMESTGIEVRILYQNISYPPPPTTPVSFSRFGPWTWLVCPTEYGTKCNCYIHLATAINARYSCYEDNKPIPCPSPPGLLPGGEGRIRTTNYIAQTNCDDLTPPEGPTAPYAPPNVGDFCKAFPFLCKRKKRNPKCCQCCNSQWLKNPNGLYLPSRYKI